MLSPFSFTVVKNVPLSGTISAKTAGLRSTHLARCSLESHSHRMTQIVNMQVGDSGQLSRSLPCDVIHSFNTMPSKGEHVLGMFSALCLDDALSHRIADQNATTLPTLDVLPWNIKHRYTKFRNSDFPFPFQTTNHLIPCARVQIEQNHLSQMIRQERHDAPLFCPSDGTRFALMS